MAGELLRVGMGYDVHRLVVGRPLLLGGVQVPYPKGLLGHSDGDALIHAVIDALLGAAGLGEIGAHFPPTDPQYKDIRSTLLLEHVRDLLAQQHWMVLSLDGTIVAERPALQPYLAAMQRELAQRLGAEAEHISVKAKTNNGLGFLGAGEGIAAWAVALLQKPA